MHEWHRSTLYGLAMGSAELVGIPHDDGRLILSSRTFRGRLTTHSGTCLDRVHDHDPKYSNLMDHLQFSQHDEGGYVLNGQQGFSRSCYRIMTGSSCLDWGWSKEILESCLHCGTKTAAGATQRASECVGSRTGKGQTSRESCDGNCPH
jgi:hypothetical protein